MRAVIIVANPNQQSFSHAIAQRVHAAMQSNGHGVIVHDLYAEGFRAAMTPDERNAHHGDAPVLDPLVDEHIVDITSAQTLVFVYPTWWSSMPAILKGWLERVMVPGVGFVFDDQHRVRPGLTNVKRLVGISTYGAKWHEVKLTNDNGRRTIKRALRISTGWRTRCTWIGLYAMDTTTNEQRTAFLDKVEKTARSW